jgi:hypothetical protein
MSIAQQRADGDADLSALTPATRQAMRELRAGYTPERAHAFLHFQARLARELFAHRVIRANVYTTWFRTGEASEAQLRAFIVQFSVFSNQFLIAQAYKMVNAVSLEGMRASKEILANELGVTFVKPGERPGVAAGGSGSDPDRAGTEGSVQGGVFHFEAGHFEWLWATARHVGLAFGEIGRRRHGTPGTLHFCDELVRLYGSESYEVSQAASFAVENWAAAGFWKDLIAGFRRYNQRNRTRVPLGFFVWHDRLEAQHARHTRQELEEYYFQTALDEDAFIRYGNEMLDAVAVFWDGLEAERLALAGAGARTLAARGSHRP